MQTNPKKSITLKQYFVCFNYSYVLTYNTLKFIYLKQRQYDDENGSILHNGNIGGRPYPHRDHTLHYRPQSGVNTAADANSGIFSSISNGFNNFVTNLFG